MTDNKQQNTKSSDEKQASTSNNSCLFSEGMSGMMQSFCCGERGNCCSEMMEGMWGEKPANKK